MSRKRPFEMTFRVVGALLDVFLLDVPAAAARTARDAWDTLPWSRQARRTRAYRRQKRLNDVYKRAAQLYGNHTPAFRAAVTEELQRMGEELPPKWIS